MDSPNCRPPWRPSTNGDGNLSSNSFGGSRAIFNVVQNTQSNVVIQRQFNIALGLTPGSLQRLGGSKLNSAVRNASLLGLFDEPRHPASR